MSGLERQVFDLGYEIVKDDETDYFCYKARFWVEDSELFDTPEEAARACIERNV
mgnify:CR=1 FL=1